MKLRFTHLLSAGPPGRPSDGIGRGVDGARFFVPGWIPCGECGRCRRGLVTACPRGRTWAGLVELEVDGRFLTPIDEPAGAPPIDDPTAACAGVVAGVIEATGRAGLGPEQVAVWIGDEPALRIGARLSARRGCATFLAGAAGDASPADRDVIRVGSDVRWSEAIGCTTGGEPRERRLFAAGDAAAQALPLCEPGATLVLLGALPDALALDPGALALARLLVGDGRGGFHPDFVPEALALLRRAPDLLEGLVASGSAPVAGRLAVAALA